MEMIKETDLKVLFSETQIQEAIANLGKVLNEKYRACILEVKWDNFLPDVIRDAVQLDCRRSAAFSKYAASRMYD